MKEALSNIKHERSAKQYPEIDLQKGEYVVLEMKRAKIGLALLLLLLKIQARLPIRFSHLTMRPRVISGC